MTSDLREDIQRSLGGGYTVERELGGGGMSRVFVARDEALGREIVVKVLSPDLSASLSAERFTREIKLAAALQDPHIVPLIAAGTTADGLPFYTMPFVRGDSLRARLTAGPVPIAEALEILRNLAQALAHAHERGVVHRDIKPENVLLSRGTAMVTDFGIAKAVSASSTQAPGTTLTAVGTTLGTPAYMAPEQVVGDGNTDHRADLYAWGVVAYELLAGAHPFAHHATAQAVVAAHLSEAPRPLLIGNSDLSRSIVSLVMQCLAKEPEQRPGSADELLRRLVVPLGMAEASRGPGRPGDDARARRHRALLAGAGIVACIAAGFLVLRERASRDGGAPGAASAADSAAPVRSLVVLPFESVSGDTANAYFGEGMADELSNLLAKVPGLQLVGRSSARALRGKLASPREIGRALNVGGVLEGTVRRAEGRMRVSTQLTNTASGLVVWSESFERPVDDVFAVQDDPARAIANALRVTLTTGAASAAPAARGTASIEAYDLYQRGMYFYQRRGPGLVGARDYFIQAISRDSGFARAYAGLAMAWIQWAVYSDTTMRSVLPRAIAAGERAVALDSTSAAGWTALGLLRTYQRRWREADAATARALQLDPRDPQAHFSRGRWALAVGNVDEAIDHYRQASAADPFNAPTLSTLAQALTIGGKFREAAAVIDRAWEIDSTISPVQANGMFIAQLSGNMPLAVRRAEVALRIPANLTTLATAIGVIALSGDTARADQLTRQYASRYAGVWKATWITAATAEAHGDQARALASLEQLVSSYDFGIVQPVMSHRFDWLRGSPRFAALVASLGLDSARFTAPGGGRPR